PVPAGEDPAFWQPEHHELLKFQAADIILLNGADYAKWIAKSSLPLSRCVNTSDSFRGQYLKMDEKIVHSHGSEGEHEHDVFDFNTWLNPLLAVEHANAVWQKLVEFLPEKKEELQKNYLELEKDLMEIDIQLERAFANKTSYQFIASHPVYGYLAKRYQLDMVSLHWEPDQMPVETEWQQLKEWYSGHPKAIMLWEGQPSKEIADRLSHVRIPYCVFVPCGNKPESGDYFSVMEANISALNDL
ncbi:MAG: metal ABC transporter substrate-binding protein, partial [Bacteroidales bacterium]|nr:metal ABC transporter substrate-binding protein [Bacteroidales bacterium]